MPKMIPAFERIRRARVLIEEARAHPAPAGFGKNDLGYIARVKDILRQARDLIKFIPQTPTATDAMKAEVKKIFEEIEAAERQILRS
jgi:hypothetical protein